MNNSELRIYKKQAIRIAKDLFYSESVIKQLKEATSSNEVERIMIDARRGVNNNKERKG